MPSLTADVIAADVFTRPQPPVAGDGVLLRPWALGDAPAVLEAFGDPDIQSWHVRSAGSLDEVTGWIGSWISDWATGRHANWAVADPDTNDVLGRVSIKHIDVEGGEGGVAYWTMPHCRRRGVASRAVRALTRWAFQDIGFHRLELTHSVHNTASCRVAIKTGFDLEGTKRGAGLHRDGWHDMHLHARLADD